MSCVTLEISYMENKVEMFLFCRAHADGEPNINNCG